MMGAWLRRNGLRILFTASLAWAVLGLFMETIFGWVPDERRAVIEPLLIAATTLACVIAVWAISRCRPGFLLAPPGVSLATWVTRGLVVIPLVYVLLAIACGLLAFAGLRIKGDPSDPQYGVSLAWAIVWYPAILTPVVSLVTMSRTLSRAAR
jgi:hypothetical protein